MIPLLLALCREALPSLDWSMAVNNEGYALSDVMLATCEGLWLRVEERYDEDDPHADDGRLAVTLGVGDPPGDDEPAGVLALQLEPTHPDPTQDRVATIRRMVRDAHAELADWVRAAHGAALAAAPKLGV